MKFTRSWLATHLDTDAALDRITDTLTMIGLELEGVENRGAALAPFRIAKVVEAVPHPNADRLRVCQIETGEGVVSVVCGAPNARSGMKAVFAPPGSQIPGTGITLKVGEIRGVQSAGMLLSAREMGLGDDNGGIVELPEDAPVGLAYVAWAGLDDPLIDVAVTPNRGDALGVRGIARDLAAAGIGRLLPWQPQPVQADFASPRRWEIEATSACPWILGRSFRGLRNGPSPKWLADRLMSVGLRPISALVDVTNFFTIDIGRPLHVFDADKLVGARMVIRDGRDETYAALDGRSYVVTQDDIAVADDAGVRSLGGVMGGAASGCSATTTAVFLEVALFDAVRVALSGRRHQIHSDARARFERGLDAALLPAATEAASRMILDLCGGEASEIVAAGGEPAWQRHATLRFERLAGLGGLAVDADITAARLDALGFATVARDATRITVSVPSWRNDIATDSEVGLALAPSLDAARAKRVAEGVVAIEPEAELVEEVLRLGGLDAVPAVSLPRAEAVPLATLTAAQAQAALARRVLAARGLAECVSFSFMARDDAMLFGGGATNLHLANPIAADLDQLRPTPLATLLRSAMRNAARGEADGGVFEIGPAFDESGQHRRAAGLRQGATPRDWNAPARAVDALDAKADALAVLTALGVAPESLAATAGAPVHFHPGRSGVLRQGKRVLAVFGLLHPGLLGKLDAAGPIAAFEIMLDLIPPAKRRRGAADLPALQAVKRDMAFVAPANVAAETLLKAARQADRSLITNVALFDVYEGAPLPQGHRSLAIEVTLQPRDHTLADREIEAACARVIAAVTGATGATLRG